MTELLSTLRDENLWKGEPIPVTFKGAISREFEFSAIVVGMTTGECGFRSSDERFGQAPIESLLRQPMLCRIELPGITKSEIKCRLMRLEPCRKDPAYLYFGTAHFLEEFDVEIFAKETGLALFSKERPHRPVISRPPPPPSFKVSK